MKNKHCCEDCPRKDCPVIGEVESYAISCIHKPNAPADQTATAGNVRRDVGRGKEAV
jgi:hypothetical protein